MSYLIAAAGTGGHVFPGLSVAEALVEKGVPIGEIVFVGGDRLEKEVYPAEGFPFFEVEVRGLRRELDWGNLTLPVVVMRARRRIRELIQQRGVRVTLGMGGYVTIPTAMAASSAGITFMNAEQNAEAGLANRFAARWASRTFGAFPVTGGLPGAEWAGNPVRRPFWDFDRDSLRPRAREHYGLSDKGPVLGVVGGSLGAKTLNVATSELVAEWEGPPLQVVHLTGPNAYGIPPDPEVSDAVSWHRVGFEEEMELFYAVTDLAVARAGGAVAELTATGTPAVLVPGRFGSGRHQRENAAFLAASGAAVTVPEEEISDLPSVVSSLLGDAAKLSAMRVSAEAVAKPRAAVEIALAMMEAAE
jgi:UDP-N-acetylglucosamine--N-acetylmuramyl-(pentapeptide) pyrophosphoryl-undecaprenol N-acetylglucosamine transferase